MHKDAKQYFAENPDEPYWYYPYTPNLRVPNPQLKPWLQDPRPTWRS